MKTTVFSLSLLLAATLFSCSEKDEPDVKPEPFGRIAAVSGDKESEEYSYDENGKLSRWKWSSEGTQIQANYSYPAPDEIKLVTMTTDKMNVEADARSICDEKLHIGSNGLIDCSDGVITSYEDLKIVMKRKYRLEFAYDSENRLTAITESEWRQSGDGWEEKPLTWTNPLEWADGKLIKYTDYLGNKNPYITISYSYYGGPEFSEVPLAFPPIRNQYMPLQLKGYFGAQPAELVSKVDKTWENGTHLIENYSYSFSVSATDSRIEAYTITTNKGTENTYRILWE